MINYIKYEIETGNIVAVLLGHISMTRFQCFYLNVTASISYFVFISMLQLLSHILFHFNQSRYHIVFYFS